MIAHTETSTIHGHTLRFSRVQLESYYFLHGSNLLKGYEDKLCFECWIWAWCTPGLKQHIKTVSPVIQSTPKDLLWLLWLPYPSCHTPLSHTQINNKFPFIYSYTITAANCFVNGTVPSASPVNTMSLAMLIILLFAWPGALERRPFPWFNYCGLGSGENESWTLKPPVLMTFKLITATCCYGVAHLKVRVMKRGALHYRERN